MANLNVETIKTYINKQNANRLAKISIFDTITSTNDYLLQLPYDESPQILVCLAEHQTAGRGRYGRKWISPHNANIYLSLRWLSQKSHSTLTQLSTLIAEAIQSALTELGIPDIQIKPPNDILWHGRKLAGILIETKQNNALIYSVIGVGLNVNMPSDINPKIDQPWVDIKQINPQLTDRNRLAGMMLNYIITALQKFELAF